MKKTILVIFISCISAFSDDGAFTSQGNSIIPFIPTNIELKRQFLSFTLKDHGKLNVFVEFEFFNSGEEQEFTVGFVTPPKHSPEDSDSFGNRNYTEPELEDFKVFINDAEFVYEIKQLKDLEHNSLSKIYEPNNFVYYFPAYFQSGKTQIKHTYTISENITGAGTFFEYILSTGTHWANNEIEDFHLEIKMGSDAAFEVPAYLESDSKLNYWYIDGIGKTNIIDDKFLQAYLKSGKLVFKKKNFIPDIELIIKHIYPFGIGKNLYDFDYNYFLLPKYELKRMSLDELYIFRNKFFALGGYKFRSDALYKFFNQFLWYWPSENISSEDLYSTFPEDIKDYIKHIKSLEDKKISQKKMQIRKKFQKF